MISSSCNHDINNNVEEMKKKSELFSIGLKSDFRLRWLLQNINFKTYFECMFGVSIWLTDLPMVNS